MTEEKRDKVREIGIAWGVLVGVSLAVAGLRLGLVGFLGMLAVPLLFGVMASGVTLVPAIFLGRDVGGFVLLIVFPLALFVLSLFFFLPAFLPRVLLAADLPFDLDLLTGFLGFWWLLVVLAVSSAWSWPGARVAKWFVSACGHRESFRSWVLAWFTPIMPWLPMTIRPLQAARRHISSFCGRFGTGWTGLVLSLILGAGVLIAIAAFPIVFEIEVRFIVPAILVLVFATVHVLAAYVPREDEPVLRRRTLNGAMALVAAAALGYVVFGSGWGLVLAPLLLAVAGVAFLPAAATILMFSSKAARLAVLLTFFALPIAYHPLYVDTRDRVLLASSKDHVPDLAARLEHEEAARVLPKAYEEMLRRGMALESAKIAARWVPLLVQDGDVERADQVAQQTLALLGEVPFDRDLPGDGGSIQARRGLVLDLLISRVHALFARGDTEEAERLALGAWQKAVQAGLWPPLGHLARRMADFHRTAGRAVDAYWWLEDARNRIARAGGPLEEVERLEMAIEDLRRVIGEEAFRAAVEECARKDPVWCGKGVE